VSSLKLLFTFLIVVKNVLGPSSVTSGLSTSDSDKALQISKDDGFKDDERSPSKIAVPTLYSDWSQNKTIHEDDTESHDSIYSSTSDSLLSSFDLSIDEYDSDDFDIEEHIFALKHSHSRRIKVGMYPGLDESRLQLSSICMSLAHASLTDSNPYGI
jgi:hypothetical protein